LRRVLEGYAVEEAARLATPEHIQKLDQCYSEYLEAAEARDPQVSVRRDFSLHVAIWETAGNEYLEAALRRIAVPLFAFTAIRRVSHDTFDLMQDARSHLPILEAIKKNDPQAARTALLAALEEWRSRKQASVFDETSSE
jgi:DNA-binding GntR family transcriptional regulator